MRQIDQLDSEDKVKSILADSAKKYNGRVIPSGKGWTVTLPDGSPLVSARALMVMEANTPWSPIYDANGAEHELHYKHGIPAKQMMPEIVQLYRDILTTQHYEGDD
jgi:hypothetical protein